MDDFGWRTDDKDLCTRQKTVDGFDCMDAGGSAMPSPLIKNT